MKTKILRYALRGESRPCSYTQNDKHLFRYKSIVRRFRFAKVAEGQFAKGKPLHLTQNPIIETDLLLMVSYCSDD